MTVINPDKREYQTPDGLEVAKDIAWVFKSLWGIAAVFAIAIAWGVTLANEVAANTSKVQEAATQEQIHQVLTALQEIKSGIKEVDERQRDIKSQVDKLETKIDTIEKRDE